MKKRDLLTNEEFVPKRINQKFANPQNRIAYNNDRANKIRHHLNYINKPLLSQWRALNDLLSAEREGVFHKEYLLGKGISFELCTHYELFEEKQVNAIYDFLIIVLNENFIKILRND